MRNAIMFFTASLLAFGYYANSQTPTIAVVRLANPPVLDGTPDEACWQTCPFASEFWQHFPLDTVQAEGKTRFRMGFDDENLYIAAEMFNYGKPRSYVIPSLRRDYRGISVDGLTFMIDPFQGNNNGYHFGITPFGVQREGLIANGGQSGNAFTTDWDNKWVAQAAVHEDRWTAEIAIPLRILRFEENKEQWNLNVYRLDSHWGEQSSWVRVPRNLSIVSIANMGIMQWEKAPEKPAFNASVIPYVLASTLQVPGEKPENKLSAGLDARMGLGSGMSLDVTVNPDFSQVEVDQQVTNLDRFELFFPERRQFFLENADLFASFGNARNTPFFSRRIGIARDTNTGQLVQNPIYGGVRVSGNLPGKWRLGAMSLQTTPDDSFGLLSTNYSVAAVQKQVFSRSNLSLLAVNKQTLQPKTQKPDTLEPDTESVYNRTLALDYNFSNPVGSVYGKAFYHRLFAPQTGENPYTTAFSVVVSTLKVEANANIQAVGAGYTPEVGFVRRRNFLQTAGNMYYNFYGKERSLVVLHGPGLDADRLTTFQGLMTDYDVNLLYRVRFTNTARADIRLREQYVRLDRDFDPTNTEGIPLAAGSEHTYRFAILNYDSDGRKQFNYKVSLQGGEYYNGKLWSASLDLNYRWQPLGVFSLNMALNRIDLPRPYASTTLLLIGPKLDFTFTRNLFWTTFVQYNNQVNNVNINSRLQWRYKPVSDLFLVYTGNYFPDTWGNKGHSIVLKASYWLNI